MGLLYVWSTTIDSRPSMVRRSADGLPGFKTMRQTSRCRCAEHKRYNCYRFTHEIDCPFQVDTIALGMSRVAREQLPLRIFLFGGILQKLRQGKHMLLYSIFTIHFGLQYGFKYFKIERTGRIRAGNNYIELHLAIT